MTEERDAIDDGTGAPDADEPRSKTEETAGPDSPVRPRRRYLVVIVLALAMGAAGALAGWDGTKPVYRSKGLISVAASVPTPRDPEGRNVVPRLDDFVKTQAAFLASRRVIERAMASDDWQRTGSRIDLAGFEDRLKVGHKGKSLHIAPKFSDAVPETAAAGVKAIIRAYMELSADIRGNSEAQTIRYLRDRESSLGQVAQRLDNEVRKIAARFGGAEGLGIRLEALHREVAGLETSRRELDRQIRLEQQERESRATGSLTPEEWSLRDETMKELLVKRQVLEARIEVLLRTHGAQNPALILARQELEQLTLRSDRRAKALNETRVGAEVEIERLIARRSILDGDIETVRKAALEVGKVHSDLQRLTAERERLGASMLRIREAMDQVRAELAVKGRILVLSEGDVPVTPHRDRRLAVAAGVGAAGFGLVVLVALVWGFLGRRRTAAA